MISVVIRSRVLENQNVVRIVFASEDGKVLPTYDAGAHIDVYLPSGLIRQYSLCQYKDSGEYYEIAVLKEPESQGGSEEIHHLSVGDKLNISYPRQHFSLVKTSRKSILIAGGIGVTPLLSMAYQLNKQGFSFELHYCVGSPEEQVFRHELENAAFSDSVYFHFSQVKASGRLDILNLLSKNTLDTEIYICGPESLIFHVLLQAEILGWPQDRLHREFFSAPTLNFVAKKESAFKVKVHSTGAVFDVGPEQTITQVLDDKGIYIPVSCEEGVCGTCQTKVISGTPDHADVYLSVQQKAEGKFIMPCCSRSKSALLELDL
ncbi:MAG: PDR/VanB family oxidoreductase [Marinomonas sp.]